MRRHNAAHAGEQILAGDVPNTLLIGTFVQVQSILMHVAEKLGKGLQDLCERISWPLAAKYPSAYEAFTLAVQ